MANLAGQRTFVQIQNEIGQHLFGATSLSATTHPTLTMVKQGINKHYKLFYMQFRNLIAAKETSVNTTAGQQYIVMPDDVMEVMQMAIRANSVKLRYCPRKEFLDNNPGGWTNVGQAIPCMYIPKAPASNNALQFDLYPTPDATYAVSVNYQARPTELSADSDVPVIQPEFDPYLVHAPLAEYFAMLNDDRAKYHDMRAREILKDAWLKNEQTADYMDSVKDYGGMINPMGWPGQYHPYL